MIRGGLFLFAIYILMVGWRENGDELIANAGDDVSGFGAWIAAWAMLMMLRSTPAKPVVDPLITLAVVTTILSRWQTVKGELQTSYKLITENRL